MTRLLAITSLALALALALAAPALAFMPDTPSDPPLAPWPGQECPPGLYWSHQIQQCVSSPENLPPGGPPMALPGQGAPPPPEGCPPGLRWSRRQARCVESTTWTDCGPYHRWSGRWRRCLPLCPPGYYYDPGLGDCAPQAPGYDD
ncbi:MAG: hypothetical protein HY794_09225 [Desulfarculus sp.]|nr:hypothetical protein [Desulfarculus sp.]